MAYIVAARAGAVLNALVQVEIERRSIDGFNECEGLAIEKCIPTLALVECVEERPIGVIVIGYPELAEIEMRIAGAVAKKAESWL